MPLMTLVYNTEREHIINGIKSAKEYFKSKNINIGISENMENNTHFLKMFSDCHLNERLMNIFNIHMAGVLYNILIDEFYEKNMDSFLKENYFFLQFDEIQHIKHESFKLLEGDISIADGDSIYCINKKNDMLIKIVNCINENYTINVEGLITFRMKDILKDIEDIVDKVVENYMVEKEYEEFIKLLKYFVEIQESKMECMNIFIKKDGDYVVKNNAGKDITKQLFRELSEFKTDDTASQEDMLISVLITNSPETIIIHSIENCKNNEFIDTIKRVFEHRVKIFDSCNV